MATDAYLHQLKKAEHKTYREIAALTGLSEDGIRSRVSGFGSGKRGKREVIIQDDLYYPSARDINDNDEWMDYLKWAKRRDKMLKIMFWSDPHFNDQSKQSILLARQIRRALKPDVDFLLGDEFDLDTLSVHWPRAENRRRVDAFKEVAPEWYNFHDELDDDLKGVQRVMIGGNHTLGRVESYVNEKAPELADTIIESFIALARANNRVKWLGWTDDTWINNYHIEHGTRTGENSSKNSLKDLGWGSPRTGGHVHSPSEAFNYVYVPTLDVMLPRRVIVHSVTLPCLCNIHAHYANDKKKSRWINGVGVAYVNLNGLDVHQHKIIFHTRANGDMVAAFGADEFTQSAKVGILRKVA